MIGAWILLQNMLGQGAQNAAKSEAQRLQENAYGVGWSWPPTMAQSCMTTMMVPDRQHVVVHHVIDKPKPNHCENCGAPPERHSVDCSYCGTEDAFA